MCITLPAVRRWRLRPGGLTLLFTINAALMAILQDYYAFALVGLAAGIAPELLLQRLPQSPRPRAFQLFAFLVPAVYYLLYLVALTRMANISPSWGTWTRVVLPHPLEGIAWNVQLWTGTALAAGLVGWAVSLLVLPAGPARPPSSRSRYWHLQQLHAPAPPLGEERRQDRDPGDPVSHDSSLLVRHQDPRVGPAQQRGQIPGVGGAPARPGGQSGIEVRVKGGQFPPQVQDGAD